MRNNSIWFQSPFPRPYNFLNAQLVRQEEDRQNQSSNFNHQPYLSTDLPVNNFKLLSPWSKLLNYGYEQKEDHLSLPGILPSQDHHMLAIEQKLIYSDNEDQELVTPIKQEQLCRDQIEQDQLHTTAKKQQFQQLSISKSKPREKGLRRLSQQAFSIVQELKNTTYKDVASILVKQFNEQEIQGDNNEEQNIKRRVYDALNVLIALGVLKKEGRKIVSEKRRRGRKIEFNDCGEVDILQQKCILKQSSLYQKQIRLKQAQQKKKAIAALLSRNKRSEAIRSKISFPFIGMIDQCEQNEQRIKWNGKYLVIRSVFPLQPFGDIDSLKWISQEMNDCCRQDYIQQC